MGKAGGRIGTASKVPIIEALRDINLNLRQGQRVGLVGHNGSGKSTLLRLMSGIYEPSHSDEFLVDLCDTAIWMDHGEIKNHGPIMDVLNHYKGRNVCAELSDGGGLSR